MSSCTVFVFLSLIEYAFVNVMMGDISEVERKDKTSHLRNIIVTANTSLQYPWQQQKYPPGTQSGHPASQSNFPGIKVTQPSFNLYCLHSVTFAKLLSHFEKLSDVRFLRTYAFCAQFILATK